jgi:hypothetical protein
MLTIVILLVIINLIVITMSPLAGILSCILSLALYALLKSMAPRKRR